VKEMKRIKKILLLQIRWLALHYNQLKLYYWAEKEISELRTVFVMPELYYRFLFFLSMRLVQVNGFELFADKAIHTIPYHVRFKMA
jgi:hypothetical protein